MTLLRPRVAVFDLDGTLADTAADLIAAANATFDAEGLGMPLSLESDRVTAFAGGRAMLKAGFLRLGHGEPDMELIGRLYPRLLEFYRDAICVHTCLYDGAETALDRLAGAGWRLAVCTNKPFDLAELLLRLLGIHGRFAAVLGADSLAFRKPDPRHLTVTVERAGGVAGRAVLVGDTITDRTAAEAAGLPCVLVGFGPEGDAVGALAPAAVLGHYDDLPPLLERLVPGGKGDPAGYGTHMEGVWTPYGEQSGRD